MQDTTAPTTEAQLIARRRAAVAFLAYAYMLSAWRESPAASGLHTVFVRWYLANRSLYPADTALQAMERSTGQRLTSELGYTAMSGYACGVALSDVGPAFAEVWRTAPPASQAGLPEWMERRGFFNAAGSVPGIDTLDSRLRVSLDPVRVPQVAGELVAEFINTGVIAQRSQPVPGSTPGEIRAMEYEGTPEGPKGSVVPTPSASVSTSLTTTSSSLPSALRTAGSAQVAVGVVSVGVVGYVLYLIAKRVKK